MDRTAQPTITFRENKEATAYDKDIQVQTLSFPSECKTSLANQ